MKGNNKNKNKTFEEENRKMWNSLINKNMILGKCLLNKDLLIHETRKYLELKKYKDGGKTTKDALDIF